MLFGSSPLARGTYRNLTLGHNVTRLIPARAGNISSITKTVSPRSAHPRSRGEHAAMCPRVGVAFGSSPLARGTSFTASSFRMAFRLIPARAGNIHTFSLIHCAAPAHPRSRGEHYQHSQVFQLLGGSSPLARGTFIAFNQHRRALRLIPARAGNIGARPQFTSWRTAHPRSRGEHTRQISSRTPELGSSPLARGTSLLIRPPF